MRFIGEQPVFSCTARNKWMSFWNSLSFLACAQTLRFLGSFSTFPTVTVIAMTFATFRFAILTSYRLRTQFRGHVHLACDDLSQIVHYLLRNAIVFWTSSILERQLEERQLVPTLWVMWCGAMCCNVLCYGMAQPLSTNYSNILVQGRVILYSAGYISKQCVYIYMFRI